MVCSVAITLVFWAASVAVMSTPALLWLAMNTDNADRLCTKLSTIAGQLDGQLAATAREQLAATAREQSEHARPTTASEQARGGGSTAPNE